MKRLLIGLFLAPSLANAIDISDSLSIKGFGSVGGIATSLEDADYVPYRNLQAVGVGRSSNLSIIDSKAGLQVDWKATKKISLSTQVVSKYDPDGSYDPYIEWGFLKYSILPDLQIRVGRIRPPIYKLSDSLDVNYANPWIRPPIELYYAAPITHIEGLDFKWKTKVGKVTFNIQPYYGNSNSYLTNGKLASMNNFDVYGINITSNYDKFSFRLGYFRTGITIHDKGFDTLIVPTLANLCGLGELTACSELHSLNSVGKEVTYMSAGAEYNNGKFFIASEVGKRHSTLFISDVTNFYVTSGVYLDKVTPYILWSESHNYGNTKFTRGIGPLGEQVNQISTLVRQNNAMDQRTVALGIRYDILKNVDIKFQWDRIDTFTKNGQLGTGSGIFVNTTPGFANKSNTVDLYSVSVDFIF